MKSRFIIPIIILFFGLRNFDLFPKNTMKGWFNSPTQALLYGALFCTIFIVVFTVGKRMTKVKEIETSQSIEEVQARNASAIQTHTQENVKPDFENKVNTYGKRSIWFFTKKEIDGDNT